MYLAQERQAGGKIRGGTETTLVTCLSWALVAKQVHRELPEAVRRGVTGAGVAPKGGFTDKLSLVSWWTMSQQNSLTLMVHPWGTCLGKEQKENI